MHLLTADDATLALSVHGINGSKKQLLQLYGSTTFGHRTFGHKTFGHKTFGHKVVGATFGHSIIFPLYNQIPNQEK